MLLLLSAGIHVAYSGGMLAFELISAAVENIMCILLCYAMISSIPSTLGQSLAHVPHKEWAQDLVKQCLYGHSMN